MANPFSFSWIWKAKCLNWWVSVLFMIGSALFALGCMLFLAAVEHEFILDSVFFAGSLFFTSAAYCQLHQTVRTNKIAFRAALAQFIGTLLFNMNTLDAFFNLGWIGQDVLVWVPNILGSILFQIAGTLAIFDLRNQKLCWQFRNIEWWIGFVNFWGCVAFLISATLAFTPASLNSEGLVVWSTTFTLIGACCFFVGAFLMWIEMGFHEKRIASTNAGGDLGW